MPITKKARRTTIYALIAVFVLASHPGCNWTPKVYTPIFEGPQGAVALESVPDETFRASHPLLLSVPAFSKLLKGLHMKQHPGLLQTLIGGEDKPERVLSDSQVDFLAPLLVNAFSQATPEEHVVFSLSQPNAFGEKAGSGTMFAHNTKMFVTLDEPGSAAARPPKSPGASTSDPLGLRSPTFVFVPNGPNEDRGQQLWSTLSNQPNTLVVSLDYLTHTPTRDFQLDQRSKDAPLSNFPQEPPSQPPSASSVVDPLRSRESLSTPGKSGITISEPPASPSQPQLDDLVNELRKLNQELKIQRAELERLKNAPKNP